MNILITSGATRESIDSIRFITNHSTGKTGSELADFFSLSGHKITLLAGASSLLPTTRTNQIRILRYTDFQNLNTQLEVLLAQEGYDGIIHLAAISDYSIQSVEIDGKKYPPFQLKKIDSQSDICLHMKKNFKMVNRLKSYSKKNKPIIIAFKLTYDASLEEEKTAVYTLGKAGEIDWIVHNDLGKEPQIFSIYEWTSQNARHLQICETRSQLAKTLETLIQKRIFL